jgi:hypothetical protein
MLKTTVHRIGLWVLVFMTAAVWFTSSAYAITPINATVSPEVSKQAASQRTLRQSVEFLISIKDNVLYTETNSYSLQNVRITYKAAQPIESVSPNSKKIVELMFLNNVLKEAVIHQ